MDYKLIVDIFRLENKKEYLSNLITSVVEVFEKEDALFYAFCFDAAGNKVEVVANYDFFDLIEKLATGTCPYSYEHLDKYSEDWYDEDLGE
nr:MAG TPA: hypothetical protein [Caudoviricetes sp.]